MKTIGQRIKELREKHGMTMQDLAEKIATNRGNISSYEKDKYEPSAQTIVLLCRHFGVSADWLLTGEEAHCRIPPKIEMEISPMEQNLLQMLRILDDRDKEDVFGTVKMKYDRASGKSRSLYSTYGNGKEKSRPEDDNSSSVTA